MMLQKLLFNGKVQLTFVFSINGQYSESEAVRKALALSIEESR